MNRRRLHAALPALLALLIAGAGPGGHAAAAQEGAPVTDVADLDVREVTLDNGMRFLILPRPGAPTVAFVTQYAVGGVNERRGHTGIAHLLEHMLFKGTTTVGTRDLDAERRLFDRIDAVHDTLVTALLEARSLEDPDTTRVETLRARLDALEEEARAFVVPNEFDRILTRNGARGLNATTSSEATTYYVELPANRAQLWFVLEADRMRNPVFREFYAERRVVMEERRMRVETSAGGLLVEEHLAAAFQVHPYGQPVVGHMADLETLSRDEVADYYRRYYGPRNAVVAIVGDVDPDQVGTWAREYFGPIAPGEVPPAVEGVEPPQRGERRVEVEFDAEPILRMGWKVPEARHGDAPALAMLTALLTGGRTGRLYDRLVVDERLATFVTTALDPGERFPRLFSVYAVPRAPHTTLEVETAVRDEIAAIARTAPDEAELQRVRNQIDAGRVRRLLSNLGLAFQLADSEALYGDWATGFAMAARIARVTPSDVQRVAARYLTDTRLTVATLVPPAGRAADGGGGP